MKEKNKKEILKYFWNYIENIALDNHRGIHIN
jgi:hypothetical protein